MSLIVVSITIFAFIYDSKKEELYNLKENSLNIQTDFYLDNDKINSFFIYDLVDTNFFKSEISLNISTHDSILAIITNEIEKLTSQTFFINETDNNFDNINKLLTNYKSSFDSLVLMSLKRGFKDFGYVGKMREYAHQLEEIDDFDKAKTLMLRRHEKDYIIRGTQKYVDLFIEKNRLYKNEIINSNLTVARKDTIGLTLDAYLEAFLKVVECDSMLGIKSNTGLVKKLADDQNKIQANIDIITFKTDVFIKKSKKRLRITFILLSVFLIIVSFSVGLILTKYLTRPISKLSKNIKTFVESDFKHTENFDYKTKITEIVLLIEYYFSMKTEIKSLLFNFEQKVKEKTEEVQAQKETIEKQKAKVDSINKKMVDSIKYAKQIQDAILPSKDELSQNFNNHFVIFKPRDIVSGDFLWFKRIKNNRHNVKLFAVADCTGHGVPGALMSMLSIAYLNEIVLRKEIIYSNEILEVLRLNIISNFQHDGLDIAIAIIDLDKETIDFSGANRNLYLKQDKELIKIKGNRMPIGKYPTTDLFKNKIIKYSKGDKLFAFSDGITDQLNQEGNKFSTKKFLGIIEKENDFDNCKKVIVNNFEQWRIKEEQTDDILVFGAEL